MFLELCWRWSRNSREPTTNRIIIRPQPSSMTEENDEASSAEGNRRHVIELLFTWCCDEVTFTRKTHPSMFVSGSMMKKWHYEIYGQHVSERWNNNSKRLLSLSPSPSLALDSLTLSCLGITISVDLIDSVQHMYLPYWLRCYFLLFSAFSSSLSVSPFPSFSLPYASDSCCSAVRGIDVVCMDVCTYVM